MTEAERLFIEAFNAELSDKIEEHPDTSEWSAAGKGKTKARPNGEDGEWWKAHGPGMVQSWIDWRHKSKWRTWTTPDGQPAIELGLEVMTPAGRMVKMFIDRIFVTEPTKQLAIVDLKSGARTPESDLQLGFYRYGIFKQYGIDIRLGGYWMARKGGIETVEDLTRFKPALIEAWLARFDRAIGQGIFIPHPTTRCRSCSHRHYCACHGGKYQHLDPDYGAIGEVA